LLSERIRENLRLTLPQIMADNINGALLQTLPPPLNASCDPTAADAPSACRQAVIAALDQVCTAGLSAEACIAEQVLIPDNFACVAGSCAFHSIVQQVNVLPDELELVFAPDPFRPLAQLDRFYRALGTVAGVALCGPDFSTETRVNQPLATFQLGSSGAISEPPKPCPE
jgi:hypothetical protein